jgi:glycine cleavage system H lipoate-binding protein
MQYCEASPRQKLVPYSESMLSRCGSGAYRYCDLYLDLVQSAQEADEPDEPMPAPSGLRYTTNHFWMDWPADGPWHIGIDAFLARMIGPVDRILFVTPRGLARPAVALTAHEAELHLVFPEALTITGCNLYLRSTPERLTRDPYAHGWLFEGTAGKEPRERVIERMMNAQEARGHIENEARSVRHWVETLHGAACDGGLFDRGLLRELSREDALQLFYRHCSPAVGAGGRERES